MLGRRRVPDYSGDPADIRRAAIELLSRREHCAAEIRARLLARFGKEAPVEPELERLLAEEEEIERSTREHHETPHFRPGDAD